MRAWVACVLALAGCDWILPDGTESKADPKAFFSIGDPQPNVPTGTFQDALDGWSYLFDISDPANPIYECQHEDPEMFEKATIHGFPLPDDEECALDSDPSEPDPAAPPFTPVPADAPFPPTHTGLAGTNPTPPGYLGWVGADKGGCGAWATMMCDRRLGLYDPTSQVVQGEWENAAADIKMNPADGGTHWLDMAARYRTYGMCTLWKEFAGDAASYQEVKDSLDRCDAKIWMYRREGTDLVDGHVETVVAAGDNNLVTNSWGKPGAIEGGSAGGYGHWKNGERWKLADGSDKYPADKTSVFVSYVCPCDHPMMESLGQTILRSLGIGG